MPGRHEGKCGCWEAGWACSPQHCGCRCCVNTGRLDCVVEGLPRVPASDRWLLLHRLFSSPVASVGLIDVTSGKPDGAFLGHGRTPSRPASSGETPPAGQDGQDRMAMDAPAAPVVQRALLERLAQLETATVAYTQGRCSLYNFFYLAYEKGFTAKTLNNKLHEDY